MNIAINQHEVFRRILRDDLSAFTAKVFHTLEPAAKYQHNWHIDAVANQLRKCVEGNRRRLIITQPPRSLKSITTSVAFVAWALGNNPTLKFVCVSYSGDLAMHFHRQFRQVVSRGWYRLLFPNMRLWRDTDSECVTTRNGGRLAVSVGGTVTGRGADIIIIDDPLKAEDAHSEKARVSVNDWVRSTLITRQNDKRSGVIILVMQRLHEDDLAGALLGNPDWTHLDLPAIAVESERVAIAPYKHHYRRVGDALHPEREPIEVLNKIKDEIGSLMFSAQYQQRPVPVEGNIVKRVWFRRYDSLPTSDSFQCVQSWDCASGTNDNNDYSVCTTWLYERHHYYLVDVFRMRKDFPGLCRMVMELAYKYEVDQILIEDAGPGQQLIAELKNGPYDFSIPVLGIKPEGSKEDRMIGVSACIESGQVFLPENAKWLDDFLNETLAFPRSRHDDQVDSFSQFLNWARSHRPDTVTSERFRL